MGNKRGNTGIRGKVRQTDSPLPDRGLADVEEKAGGPVKKRGTGGAKIWDLTMLNTGRDEKEEKKQ